MDPVESQEAQERSGFLPAFLAGAVVVILLVGGILLLAHWTQPRVPASAEQLPFGATEQAYAEHIHFKDIRMARAANFLNQEFTYVAGTISNDGVRTLHALEVTLEFHDPFKQVVLREKQQLISRAMAPLDGGARRDFQITLEHVPAEWDQQYPSIRVSGIILE